MLTRTDIEQGLRGLGLAEGDHVLLHSSLASLGKVEGGAATVVNAFLGVLGAQGTLVVPTFRALGVITDEVKARPDAISSLHPRASVAAIGARAAEICRDHWKAELAHGENTPYTRLADLGGWICLLGVDQDRNTTLHTVEELLRLPYLKPTKEVTFDTPEGPVTRSWPFFPGPHRNFVGLDPRLRASGKMRVGRIGDAVVRLIRSRDLIEIGLQAGRENPAFALCDNPNCNDCVVQRADLARARLAQESFTLGTAASLAGEDAPRILTACRHAGIGAVELDALRGHPVDTLSSRAVATAIAKLREGGLEVIALRGRSPGPRAVKLLRVAAAHGIPRVVLPLGVGNLATLRAARTRGVHISLFNASQDSDEVSALLLRYREAGWTPGFTFRPAAFARRGECPFLGSYKKKLRRFVDQLDLEDGLRDGNPQPLARGHGEIKEMVSILRCASFRGPMVLGASNRRHGTLRDAAQRFLALLNAM